MTARVPDQRPILIAGPTASGKSALALRLAEELGGVVINADSMQVYRELRILTARPTGADEARAPHMLYGCIEGAESYSAGRYVEDVGRVLGAARDRGLRPIIVGGTGLYFKALLEGLSPIPHVPAEVRAHWRAEAAQGGAAHVHAVLAARDAGMAQRLAPTDTQRVVRALEVLDATGVSLGDWQRQPRRPVIDMAAAVPLLVGIDRAQLARNIDARFADMLAQGALGEVMQLERLGLDRALPIMTALGVRPLLGHLAGELTLEEALAAGQAETRQYAKRQLTWSRSNMLAWNSISAQETERSAAEIISFVRMAH